MWPLPKLTQAAPWCLYADRETERQSFDTMSGLAEERGTKRRAEVRVCT